METYLQSPPQVVVQTPKLHNLPAGDQILKHKPARDHTPQLDILDLIMSAKCPLLCQATHSTRETRTCVSMDGSVFCLPKALPCKDHVFTEYREVVRSGRTEGYQKPGQVASSNDPRSSSGKLEKKTLMPKPCQPHSRVRLALYQILPWWP